LRLSQEHRIFHHKGFPFGLVSLEKKFLGPFQDKTQPVEVVKV
jgi:hypothetical protein